MHWRWCLVEQCSLFFKIYLLVSSLFYQKHYIFIFCIPAFIFPLWPDLARWILILILFYCSNSWLWRHQKALKQLQLFHQSDVRAAQCCIVAGLSSVFHIEQLILLTTIWHQWCQVTVFLLVHWYLINLRLKTVLMYLIAFGLCSYQWDFF